MAVRQFNLPDPGEGLIEADVVTWKVKVGDTVKVNDIIIEIETAKSLVELPVPYAGTVTALLVSEGDTVAVGTPIIAVDDGLGGGAAPATTAASGRDETAEEEIEAGKLGGVAPGGRVAVLVGYGPRTTEAKRRPRKGTAAPAPVTAQVNQAFTPVPERVVPELDVSEPVAPEPDVSAPAAAQPVSVLAAAGAKALAKPPVRKLAKDLGVDLATITGTGPQGSITRDDIHQAAKQAEAHGAIVAYPPTRQGQHGTFAIVIQGDVQHGLWQRG